jgi:predicted  nucleic acid-binding Zn-ribbon protein
MSELYSLYKLHKIDSALHSLRQEAAALDTGQQEEEAAKRLSKAHEEVGARAKALTAEQRDIELQQKSTYEKIAGYNKKLYDGSIVSPKEIENIEKEIAMLKALTDKQDERLLELLEEAPPIVAEAEADKAQIDALKEKVKQKRTKAMERHAAIKVEFDALRAQRPAIAREVEKGLLDMYEEVRKRTGGVGMADVTEDSECSQCGMHVPLKQSEFLDSDRIVQCEGCHRILFKAVPTV